MRNFFLYWRIKRFLPMDLLRLSVRIGSHPFWKVDGLPGRSDDRVDQARVKTGLVSADG